MNRYVIANVFANNVNLNGNEGCVGIIAPSAYMGFTNLLLREQGIDDPNLRVMPIIHTQTTLEGRQRAEPEFLPKNGKMKNIEVVESVTGSVEVTIIFETEYTLNEDMIRKTLPRLKLAGGTISLLNKKPIHTAFHRMERGPLCDASVKIKHGNALVPADVRNGNREGVDKISFGDIESVKEIRNFLNDKKLKKSPGTGYIIPCPVGYKLLEDPKKAKPRIGGRCSETPHVFVAPAVGLAEVISISNSNFQKKEPSKIKEMMWQWSCDENHHFAMFSKVHLSYLNKEINNGK
jgi:hypothetical protein